MALENRLDLRLSQRLILTPQLQLAIKLLQQTHLELIQTINQELMENPLLEEVSDSSDDLEFEETNELVNNGQNLDEHGEIDFERNLLFSKDEYFEERAMDGRDLGYFEPDSEETPSFETFIAKKQDLYEYLLWQLRLSRSDEVTKKIAQAVIGNLDDDGYLRVSNEEIAQMMKVTTDDVEKAIKLVQSFDPIGVGARNLKECLLLQIEFLQLENTLVQKIINDNLNDLQNKRYQNIAKMHNVSVDEVIQAVKIIERLEPKPGRQFTTVETNYIVPDVIIKKDEDDYIIILNNEGIPRLSINENYKRLLLNKEMLSKEEREFLKEKMKRAIDITKSLDQRNRTIYKVSESILKFQRDFFDHGTQFIKPLNLKDVAEDVNLHESTVSRVTSNKYLACSHGVFPFRYFFSNSLSGEDGVVSSTVVKALIKEVIEAEDPSKPLSDQAIADVLKSKKISIARRTVTKYREELKIPPQNIRKRTIRH
ncbi:MAG: RNA polymerase factor sigma-54 [Thermodesulfovibrionales bacterium]|nr:RNA polymerase factor sigma-54 [Thermodesulfovibrionales bacterium]